MRIVVKVGSSTLSHATGKVNFRFIDGLCRVLSDLKNAGNEVILVSSGAVAMGTDKLSLAGRPSDIPTKQAAAAVGDWRLDGVTLYVTKEPCAMCAGALVNTRVDRVVYGMADPRSGCAGSALDITGFPGMLHQVRVTGGVLEEECRSVIRAFFARVRKR